MREIKAVQFIYIYPRSRSWYIVKITAAKEITKDDQISNWLGYQWNFQMLWLLVVLQPPRIRDACEDNAVME